MSLHGRVILITGAARGIGAEAARQLSAAGASVSLVGLEPELLERTAAVCGPDALAIEADVTDADAMERAVAQTVERFGGIDAVIANAGVSPAGPMRYIDPPTFDRTIEINVLGVWRTVRAALPHVIDRRGYVLVVSSLSAVAYAPGMGPYTASKAAVEAMANALRVEVRHLGVDVGVAYFSFIATDMVETVGAAIVDGVTRRRRWITVPRWLRPVLVLRGLWPLADFALRARAPEVDERFARDAAERGAAASSFVGAGGQAARERAARR
jgi:NAD(P)-dependent dehydrogenase (short-subunit alcohol dehydrogenase family)